MTTKQLLPFLACLITYCSCFGQDTLINGYWKKTSIEKFKAEFTEKTGLPFWGKIRDTAFYVTLTAKNLHYKKVLDTVFNRRGYTWSNIRNIISVKKQVPKTYTVTGRVVDADNKPLGHANVTIEPANITKECDSFGRFSITHTEKNFILKVSRVDHYEYRRPMRGDTTVLIKLVQRTMKPYIKSAKKTKPDSNAVVPKLPDLKTGSAFTPDSTLRNWPPPGRSLADQFISMFGMVLTSTNADPELNQPFISIRNKSTIHGNPHPLYILDGLIYSGDLYNINPNDVESFSILKDASATNQWGVQAGNGVINITSKKGDYMMPMRVSANVNTTVSLKPNLLRFPSMSSSDHIELTNMLYQYGYYENLPPSRIIPPAAEILMMRDKGLYSPAQADAKLDSLAKTDIRKEAMKNLYRKSLHQQYHVGVRGGDTNYHYYFSTGYDVAKLHLVGNDEQRFTMNLDNTVKTSENGPEVHVKVSFSQSAFNNNGIGIDKFTFPYEKLMDVAGNALPVTRTVRQGYKDSLTSSKLLDWNYRPIDEIEYGNNKMDKSALMLTAGLKYKIRKKIETSLSYRYELDNTGEKNLYSPSTYLTRDLINQFTQIDQGGSYLRPIPVGDIQDRKTVDRRASGLIAQVKYETYDKDSNNLIINAGTEVRHTNSALRMLRRYDLTSNGMSASIDYTTLYSMFYEPGILNTIPYINLHSDTSEHFYSYFGNGTYTYKKRFTASFSIRRDESNIFGVQANQKAVPLMSTGISYDISRERFLNSRFISQLRIRLSLGSCGNVSRSFSALTGMQPAGTNPWGLPYSTISNPPNPMLSAENVRIANIGLDFILFKNQVWGSVEYFEKTANNLLGLAPVDPTSGVSLFQGNVAAMKGSGAELVLNARFGNKSFHYQGLVMGSFVRERVTKYFMPLAPIWTYCDPRFNNPMIGSPLRSIYSLEFKGLDATTGDPIGSYNNSASKEYEIILESYDLRNLKYHGPATPVYYGSFRNTFTWKQFSLGFTVSWKGGYYFRRGSIKYEDVFNSISIGHPDITRRWQAPGDERNTNIPSLQFSGNYARDQFFNYSSALVEKGDHIRLQDFRLHYNHPRGKAVKRFNLSGEVFLYVNNIGLLYKANKSGTDPDQVNGIPSSVNFTLGAKINF